MTRAAQWKISALALVAAMSILAAARLALAQAGQQLPPPNLQLQAPASSVAPGSTAQAAPQAGGAQSPAVQTQAVPARPLPVVTITAQVDPVTAPRDETAHLIITLTWEESASDAGQPLDFEFPAPPSAQGLTLFANSYTSATELAQDKVTVKRTYTYDFHADQEGKTEVKPVSISCFRIGSKEKKNLSTQALPLTVTRPELHPGKVARHPAFIAGLALIAAGAAFLLVRPRRRARKARQQEAAPGPTPQEVFRDRLREIDRRRMAGEYDQFLLGLSAEVSRFLEEVIGVKARGLSADKVAEAVAEKRGEEWRARVADFYKLCDQVKFAGYQPNPAEMDQAMETAKGLGNLAP